MNEDVKAIINNEFDYSNIIPTIEYISYLVEYCDNVLKTFIKLIEEDEMKNHQYKEEYKTYNYKKCYGEYLEIYIKEKSYNNITCKDIESFKSAVSDGNLKNVKGVDINLQLNYRRGKGNDLTEHENSFSIILRPYEIKFARKSNYNESMMNQIENNINEILKRIPTVNTIFCTK